MPEVKVGENESIESALRRFKKKVQKAGTLSEVKKRERENANLKQLVSVRFRYNLKKRLLVKIEGRFFNIKTCKTGLFILLYSCGDMAKW